jgi:hypothetical protein
MAATIIGIEDNIPQPEFRARREENGGWSASHQITARAENVLALISAVQIGRPITSIDPTIPTEFDFLLIDSFEIAREEGDLYVANITAKGGEFDQFETGEEGGLSTEALPTYELRGTLSDQPLSRHPKYVALTPVEKTYLTHILNENYFYDVAADKLVPLNPNFDMETASEKLTTADSQDFALKIQAGETTYRVPQFTWTETTEGDSPLTPNQINKLGKISEPRGGPPDTGAALRNWLLTDASQSQSGLLYRTTLEWSLSDENGWDELLYGE